MERASLYRKAILVCAKVNKICCDIVCICHDSKWGHPRQCWTLALMEANYFWSHMQDKIEKHVWTCIRYWQDKIRSTGKGLSELENEQQPMMSCLRDKKNWNHAQPRWESLAMTKRWKRCLPRKAFTSKASS